MKDATSQNQKLSHLLPQIIRGSLHEFNQSLTAFSFTASNLLLLAGDSSKQRGALSKELASMSAQMLQAEKRYRDTLAILDWLTLDTPTLKKISLNHFIPDVLRLLESRFRKENCQVYFSPSPEPIHLVCSIGAFTYLLFVIFFSISDVMEKIQPKANPALWKLSIATEFQPTSAQITFSFPFVVASFPSIKTWLAPLAAQMEVHKSRQETRLLIRLPLKPESNNI